jgi:hypothetical protein
MFNLSFDISVTIAHLVFELSFYMKDWKLSHRKFCEEAITVLHVGPLCLAVTNRKKLRQQFKVPGEVNEL